ncbi:MAG: hypothetical protein ACTS22_00805 [Phycisphaerales bacterium]
MRTMLTVSATLTLWIAGCDQQAPSSDAGESYQGQAQSQLGRTAEMGRNLADRIEARDADLGTAAAQAVGGNGLISIPGLDLTLPEGWTQQEPANAMRLAQFDADGATVTISQMGGSVDANIDRWLGQVVDQNGDPASPEDRTDRQVAGFPASIIETYGAYLDGGMFGSPTRRENYGLVGAAIDTGGTKTFVKMTGPADVVSEQRRAFDRLLDSMRQP